MGEHSVAAVERRYDAASLRAATVITLGWHVASALPTAVAGSPLYRPALAGLAVWAAYAVIGVTAVAMASQTNRAAATPLVLFLVLALLAGAAVVSAASPARTVLDPYSWAYPSAAWFALVVLWHRPLRDMVGFCVANILTGLGISLWLGRFDRVDVARFVMTAYSVHVLQLTVLTASRGLTTLARRTAEAQQAQARIANHQLVAAAVHKARRMRSELVQQTVAELLGKLARGDADIATSETQHRLRIAISRLRRLIVETDDAPDALSHELRACADIAERRGVEVDLQAPIGTVPSLPIAVRRALTEPLIALLACARTQARITVVARGDAVSVAVVSDAEADVPARHHAEVDFSYDNEGGLSWAETRWTASSPSRS